MNIFPLKGRPNSAEILQIVIENEAAQLGIKLNITLTKNNEEIIATINFSKDHQTDKKLKFSKTDLDQLEREIEKRSFFMSSTEPNTSNEALNKIRNTLHEIKNELLTMPPVDPPPGRKRNVQK